MSRPAIMSSSISRLSRSKPTRPSSRCLRPYSGTVAKLHAQAGTIVRIGNPLADFDDSGAHADKGTVVGSVPAPKHPPRKPRE
jgi:hypothetical protein